MMSHFQIVHFVQFERIIPVKSLLSEQVEQ